jgi:GMP synthase-like glutamine amidotransferase
VPVLGICFGGQALAAALGGSVRPARTAEVGWVTVASTDPLIEPGPWFQFHHDEWTVPPQARELARTAVASQAFVLDRCLAVQFHPELTAATLRGWYAHGGDAQVRASGGDPDALLARTEAEEPAAAARAGRLVDAFLGRVAASGR